MRRRSLAVKVGKVTIGGSAPIVVQSMTNTPTHNIDATVAQILELANAGSEIVRVALPDLKAAEALPLIKRHLLDAGCDVPLVGDFHYNGHILLHKVPKCAEALDKYRINPGNAGDEGFREIVKCAIEYGAAVRIGANSGSLDQQLLARMIDEDNKSSSPKGAEAVFLDAMAASALQSAESAVALGLEPNRIVLSAKVFGVMETVNVYRQIARACEYPLHVGVTEGGFGEKGVVTNTAALSILLSEGIGDTIRVSMTFAPNESRSREVEVAKSILQSLGLRRFEPVLTSCPSCGRTNSELFRTVAAVIGNYLKHASLRWRSAGYRGFEGMRVAVMGCVVNGPGESRHANIGLSLPGPGEEPRAMVFADGALLKTLQGDANALANQFIELIESYVKQHYS